MIKGCQRMYERRYNLLKSKFNEFLLPSLLTTMANNVCIFSDALIVSFLIGSLNLAAIQVVIPTVSFIDLICWALGFGGSILMSSMKAKYDDFNSNVYFTVSMVSLVAIGIIISILGLIFIDPIVGLLCSANMEVSSQLFPLVKDFFSLTLVGFPFMCYLLGISYFSRADGMPNLSLIAIIISNGVNIVMDFVYLQVFGMNIGGAALATLTGQILASIFISYYFFSDKRTIKLVSISKIKFNRFIAYFKDIVITGFPPASIQLFITLKLFIINYLSQIVMGSVGLVAFSVCDNSSILIYMFAIGISQSMSPIISVYYQEEDYNSVGYTIRRAIKLGIISGAVMMAIFMFCPQAILFLFSINDPTYYSLVIAVIEGLIFPVGGAILLIPLIGFNGILIAFLIAEIATIIFMFAYSKYIERKSNGEYSGFFLLKKQDEDNILDLSVNANINEIADLASQVLDYLKSMKVSDLTSVKVSLAIEEMLANIVKSNGDVGTIDILIKIQSEQILISIKDQGVEFNPTAEKDGCEYDHIKILLSIADKIDYARVLGLNSTVITIKNS